MNNIYKEISKDNTETFTDKLAEIIYEILTDTFLNSKKIMV